ncbi:hypothetical protein [Niabella hibiscisoli]|uniref:hypothetical protein n=1 Tax=Niabella hibiscisoli TaxID=1825928 RepID=UPI001F0DB909|nr:hypothetical protein [Niabella hibiscisoli]MCH5721093.1 hypothetical protein [Niabella hibiscisoli]
MKTIFALLLLVIAGTRLYAQTPFTCSNQAYQVVSSSNGLSSTLYAYNVVTGTRTSVASYNFGMNAIGYYVGNNMIWGYDIRNERVVYLDAAGAFTPVAVTGLPASGFNVGAVSNNGYYYLYVTDAARHYVVDINPARTATYLKLVDPTTGYTLDTAPFGTIFSQPSINISDWVINPATGMLWGLWTPQMPVLTRWLL